MGKKAIDLTGQSFGQLTVLSRAENNGIAVMWNCVCSCGTVKSVSAGNLTKGSTVSCGCYRIKNTISRLSTHGMRYTPTYRAWIAMRRRCFVESDDSFKDYGGRGVTVCDRWVNSFDNFLSDMGVRPDGKSLDRIYVNGPYSPENCRWSSLVEQARNKRNSRFITYDGETLSMAEWCERLGGGRSVVSGRLLRGWSEARAVSEPIK